jgi:hypothetical protein
MHLIFKTIFILTSLTGLKRIKSLLLLILAYIFGQDAHQR